jgi:hypothetical protein
MQQIVLKRKIYIWIAGLLIFTSCTFLSNKNFVENNSAYKGTHRVVIFLQRWPCYLQLQNQNDLGADFIKKSTPFLGPWKTAERIDPRAVDIKDVNDQLLGELLAEAFNKKGYAPFQAEIAFMPLESATPETIMAKYQAVDSQVDAFLFCFYSPTLFCAQTQATPPDHWQRSYGLGEIIQILQPGKGALLWAGSRAALAPANSINHAFIYLSMTLFKAINYQALWELTDSQIGGTMRTTLQQCLPGPTEQDYWADAEMIQRLMVSNLQCRLRHIIPDSF